MAKTATKSAKKSIYSVHPGVLMTQKCELRRLWKGFDGGAEAHAALDAFFDRVRARAVPARASTEGLRR